MGILYKDEKDVVVFVYIEQTGGSVELSFTSDCGKFGTEENLAGYKLTPKRLLSILYNAKDYSDEEIL